MAETVICSGCKKKYAVKPELAGKRAKCKCGEKIQFPAAAAKTTAPPPPDISLDVADDKPQKSKSAIFEPLDVSAGGYDLAGDSAPNPAPVAASPGGAAVCGKCKKPLTPGAVICIACGYNQKTGSAVRTQVVREPAPRAAPAAETKASSGGAAGSRSGLMNVAIGAGLVVLGLAVTIGTYGSASEKGGSYYVFYGPVVFGGWRLIKGIGQMASGD